MLARSSRFPASCVIGICVACPQPWPGHSPQIPQLYVHTNLLFFVTAVLATGVPQFLCRNEKVPSLHTAVARSASPKPESFSRLQLTGGKETVRSSRGLVERGHVLQRPFVVVGTRNMLNKLAYTSSIQNSSKQTTTKEQRK